MNQKKSLKIFPSKISPSSLLQTFVHNQPASFHLTNPFMKSSRFGIQEDFFLQYFIS